MFAADFLGSYGSDSNAHLVALVSSQLTQDQVFRLFDLVPGLDTCRMASDQYGRSVSKPVSYTHLDVYKRQEEYTKMGWEINIKKAEYLAIRDEETTDLEVDGNIKIRGTDKLKYLGFTPVSYTHLNNQSLSSYIM